MEFEELDISNDVKPFINNNIRIARIIDDDGFYLPYLILSNGNIVRIKGKKLEFVPQQTMKTGYKTVYIGHTKKGRDSYLVHRLIACAFIPNPEDKPQVNHIDGVKSNNDISNLEWNTAKENMDHGWRTGLHKARFGDESYNHKINSKQAKKICKLLEENQLTLDEIAEKVGTTRVTVYNIKHKFTWVAISDKYMVENHTIRSDGCMRMSKEVAHAVCKDLEENKLSTHEIAEKYGISVRSVGEIYEGKTHRDVAINYNVRNHTIRPNVDKKNMHKVEDVCKLLQNSDTPPSQIARQLDVPPRLVYSILARKSWKHISYKYDFSHRKDYNGNPY